MSRIAVAMDGSALETPLTGIGQYSLNLINALGRFQQAVDLRVLIRGEWHDMAHASSECVQPPDGIARGIVKLTDMLGWRMAYLRKHLNSAKQQRQFTHGVDALHPQVIHGPGYFLPKTDLPGVVTVHDISCFRHPETHSRARVAWQENTLPETLERADHILTVSEFSKREICTYFSITADKITVTPNGVGEDFFIEQTAPTLDAVLRRYRLAANHYILAVGTREPRKNLATLIAAYAQMDDAIRTRLPLVIAGMPGWGDGRLSRTAEKLIADGQLRIVGYVKQGHLPALYAGARVFAYPSLYEGFGMPLLEAMATGTPVISSDRASLPEVVGTAGVCIPALDTQRWAEQLAALIEDHALRATLSDAGVQRARSYSWDQTAKITLEVYRAVTRGDQPQC